VRRARRKARAPGDEVPGDGAEKHGNEHRERDAVRGCHETANRVRHLRMKELRRHDRPDEVENGGEGDGDTRGHRPRPYRGPNSIRRIVEAVGEVEQERYGDCKDEKECLRVRHS